MEAALSAANIPEPAEFLTAPGIYVFGPYRMDPARGILTRGSTVVPLSDRLFQILHALIRANGATVTKETLNEMFWPDGESDNNNLAQHVHMLRRVLGERANNRQYITTVYGKGFRFVAPVSMVYATRVESSASESDCSADDLLCHGLDPFRNYVLGCHLLEQGTADRIRAAAERFREALAIDGTYVPALIGSAQASMLLCQNDYTSARYEIPKATAAITKALQLDPNSAAAHAVLSSIHLFGQWHWEHAKAEIDLALQFDSIGTLVRTSAAWLYLWGGQSEKALAQVRRAIAASPVSPALHVLLGRILTFCGDYRDAVRQLSGVIETFAEQTDSARRFKAEALLLDGQPSEAILELTFVSRNDLEDLAWRLPLLARAHAATGDMQSARDIYDRLLAAEQKDHVAHTNLIPIALALGNVEEACLHFHAAIDARELSLPLVRHSSWLLPLRKTEPFNRLNDILGANEPWLSVHTSVQAFLKNKSLL